MRPRRGRRSVLFIREEESVSGRPSVLPPVCFPLFSCSKTIDDCNQPVRPIWSSDVTAGSSHDSGEEQRDDVKIQTHIPCTCRL